MSNIKELKKLVEGTWSLPSKKSQLDDFIKDIDKIQDKYYDSFGDDSLFDYLDDAIERAQQLFDIAKKRGK